MLDKDNKMLDLDKWSPGNMDKNLKTMFVLGILICLLGSRRILMEQFWAKQQAKTTLVLGITGICPLSGQRGIMNSGGE